MQLTKPDIETDISVFTFNFSFVGFGSFDGIVLCCFARKMNVDGQHTEQQTYIACNFPEVLIL